MLHIDTALTVYILTFAAVFGGVFGSFINCMAWRIAHHENVLKGRSHCATCQHPLGILDLVPVLSYLFLKGRCRYCKEKISPRYMITELIMVLAFVAVIWKFDVTFLSLRYLVLICILLGLALVDMETYEIPDRFIVAGIGWWIVTIPLLDVDWLVQIKTGLIGAVAIGGGMLVLSILFDKITGKESLGGGDIKLFFMVGLYLGGFVSLFNLIVACIIGIIFSLGIGQKKIPFGPAISVATFVSVVCGQDIVNWYLSLF